MKALYYFFLASYKDVGFGWTLTFLSSFGQTFLISLYVPEIMRTFSISNGVFGGLYALATVVASAVMLSVGHTVDHKAVKKVTVATTIGLAFSTFLLGFSHYSLVILVVALIGLRLTGQGLMSHISLTVMSRYYDANRGKALSIAMLGYAVGEAVLPIFITTLIIWYDYEVSALVCAAFLFMYLVRLYFQDLSRFDQSEELIVKPTAKSLFKDFGTLFKDRYFWIIVPVTFTLAFVNTGIFFYQYVFVEEKGWSVALYASFFTAYAVSRFLFSIFGGIWVDAFSAKRMFRFYLIPLIIGLLPFTFMDSIMGAFIFLMLSGCTMGIAGTVKTAVLAELYGTEKLGTIQSVFTMIMVMSTALGPLVIGMMMDYNIDFKWIILSLVAMLVLVAVNAQRIAKA